MANSDFGRAGHAVVGVAILCMIPDLELRALVEVLDSRDAQEIHISQSHPSERYFEFRNAKNLSLRLAVVCCDGQSNIESAITAQNVLFRHNPRYMFLCGVGGGLKLETCKLGDVVVDCEVVYRRFTKIDETGEFQPETLNVPPSVGGRRLAQRFFADYPDLKAVRSPVDQGSPFAVHDQKILSWDYVLDHKPTRDALLRNLDRQLAVVEMEGAGFLKAVDSYSMNYLGKPWLRSRVGGTDALIIRGISDPAAGKAEADAAEQNFRRTAARNAAHTTMLLIDQLIEIDFASPDPGPSEPVLPRQG